MHFDFARWGLYAVDAAFFLSLVLLALGKLVKEIKEFMADIRKK